MYTSREADPLPQLNQDRAMGGAFAANAFYDVKNLLNGESSHHQVEGYGMDSPVSRLKI